MPGPPAVPVRMTIKRERKLRQIINAGTIPQRLVLRARIVVAAAAGDPNAKIARDLGCTENTVRQWRGRFARQGIRGIFDKRRPGRRETHGPSARLTIVATATSIRPDGESCWSQAMIAVTWADAAWRYTGPRSAGSWPTRTSARTRSAAGSTAPTTRSSGSRPGRCAVSTCTPSPAPS